MFAVVTRESSKGCWQAASEGSSFIMPFAIPASVFSRLRLREGQELDESGFFSLKEICEAEECYQKALGLLSLREHCRYELQTKLLQREFPRGIVERALDSLEEEGCLDERRYCYEYTRSRLRRKPEGKRVMEQRLLRHGARREFISDALDKVYTPETEMELARIAYERIASASDDETARRDAFLKAGFSLYQLQILKEIP